MKKIVLFIFVIGLTNQLLAQELKCNVEISTNMISATNKVVFDNLKTAITEFMNNRKWTTETFTNRELIECNIFLNITERIGTDQFNATMQVNSRRPVYKSGYTTGLLNTFDRDVSFKYSETQPLDFSENTYTSNLTSMLGFYAYMIIGLDYDSFSLNGGTPYFQKAIAISNNAQTSSADKGWKPSDGSNTRYWMINNMLDPTFSPLRECMYKYHRKGLDIMYQNTDLGRKVILESIESLAKVHELKKDSYSLRLFFDAKTKEIVDIFTLAPKDEKKSMLSILKVIDGVNANKYEKAFGE